MSHLFFHGAARPRAAARSVDRTMATPVVRHEVDPETDAFFRLLFEQAGFAMMPYHHRTLSRRLAACLRRLQVRTVAEAVRKIRSKPKLVDSVLSVVLLGVTEFWRDPHVFESLEQQVIPRILAGKSNPRIWSAACSDGQELYSVAMLLNEAGCLQDSTLLGTDCRAEAIARAQAGIYNDHALKNVNAFRRETYFSQDSGVYRIAGALRRATQWKQVNMLQTLEPPVWDLILWRNMAIYLKPEVVGAVWKQLSDRLSPGGFLVTGKAEQPPTQLGLVRMDACIYRKGIR